MTERQGVEIDYCPTCRGVWLDRGELDKLLERAERDDRDDRPDRDDRDDRKGRGAEVKPKKKKKKSSFFTEIFESLGE
jgi:Zn-finger nucleic acid-binding protein